VAFHVSELEQSGFGITFELGYDSGELWVRFGVDMTLTKNQIKTAAMKLNPGEREALAEELLLSVGSEERKEIDAAWLAEAMRRDAVFSKSKRSAKPVNQVINRLAKKGRL
jgi:hypothetical protein